MSGICLMCGESWRTHGTACRQKQPPRAMDTDYAGEWDTTENARIRLIIRQEIRKAMKEFKP